jgi:hypothetical protein
MIFARRLHAIRSVHCSIPSSICLLVDHCHSSSHTRVMEADSPKLRARNHATLKSSELMPFGSASSPSCRSESTCFHSRCSSLVISLLPPQQECFTQRLINNFLSDRRANRSVQQRRFRNAPPRIKVSPAGYPGTLRFLPEGFRIRRTGHRGHCCSSLRDPPGRYMNG